MYINMMICYPILYYPILSYPMIMVLHINLFLSSHINEWSTIRDEFNNKIFQIPMPRKDTPYFTIPGYPRYPRLYLTVRYGTFARSVIHPYIPFHSSVRVLFWSTIKRHLLDLRQFHQTVFCYNGNDSYQHICTLEVNDFFISVFNEFKY